MLPLHPAVQTWGKAGGGLPADRHSPHAGRSATMEGSEQRAELPRLLPADAAGFFLGVACGAVVLAWLCNGARGDLLLPSLWHATYNVAVRHPARGGVIARSSPPV